jgi:hypothetical protein
MSDNQDSVAAMGRNRNRNLLILGAVIGVVYGLAVRLVSHFFPDFSPSSVMTVGFICFHPFALGFIAVFLAETGKRQRIWAWLYLSWIPLAGTLLGVWLLFLEGLICILMFIPLGMLLSAMGGVAGGLAGRSLRSWRSRSASLACVMVLPFLVAPWEKQVLWEENFRQVENTIDIHAPADVIWRNIERVPAIRGEELPASWSHRIGFPDPVEATLSYEGVGGVRNATFAGGVLFLEIVDVWEPRQRLAFSIHAETVPSATLDEHVRIGGPFFDVLRGEYRLEPLGNGMVRLHLSSRQRLSTDFNWYAHLWTDAVMSDLQQRILRVIRHRCESAAVRG